jgi:hypothetical protein
MYSVEPIEDFTKAFDDIGKKYQRINELYDAIKWYLAKNPASEEFERLDGNDFLWKTGKLVDGIFPQLKILLRVNDKDKKVILLLVAEI